MFADGAEAGVRFGHVRILGEPRAKRLIGLGGITPLPQPLVDFSRFQKRGGLPLRSVVEHVDFEELGERLAQSILMKIGLAAQQMSLCGQFASLASVYDRLKGTAGVVRTSQSKKCPAASKIEIGKGRIANGQFRPECLGLGQCVAPALDSHEALDMPAANQSRQSLGIPGLRRFTRKRREDRLGLLRMVQAQRRLARKKRASRFRGLPGYSLIRWSSVGTAAVQSPISI